MIPAQGPEDPATPPNLTPANPAIYDHGITQGGSDALDVQTCGSLPPCGRCISRNRR